MNYLVMFVFGFFGAGLLLRSLERWHAGMGVEPASLIFVFVFWLLAWHFMCKAREAKEEKDNAE